MKAAIIVALDSEFEMLRALIGGQDKGTLAGNEIILRRSGMGKVNAAVGATLLIRDEAPDCIISSGVAGGISQEVKALDIVAADEIVYHDVWCGEGNAFGQVQGFPPSFKTDSRLIEAARSLGDDSIHIGLQASGDFFISTMREAGEIRSHFPKVLSVDMESGALAQVCYRFNVPFISFRLVSDAAGEDHQSAYDNFWETAGVHSFSVIRHFLNNLPPSLD